MISDDLIKSIRKLDPEFAQDLKELQRREKLLETMNKLIKDYENAKKIPKSRV